MNGAPIENSPARTGEPGGELETLLLLLLSVPAGAAADNEAVNLRAAATASIMPLPADAA